MPFVTCNSCQLTFYSAALFSQIERCPLCDEQLAVPHTAIFERAGAEPSAKGAAAENGGSDDV